MNFGELYLQAIKVKDAILAGKFAEAFALTIPIQQTIADWLRAVGLRNTGQKAEFDKWVAEMESCCAACTVVRGPDAPPTVGKLGDGTLLKIFLEALLKFAPLFFKDGEPQPA